MQHLKSLHTRACCAPLPREVNNYYSRCHGKKKDKSDCKGSCYCNSPNCDCPQRGLKGNLANADTCNCNCCKNLNTTPKQNLESQPKNTCSKCKKPKRQRCTSPTTSKNQNNCRCCLPQRMESPQRQTNICKCMKNEANFENAKNVQNIKAQSKPKKTNVSKEKKYVLYCKHYEEGDSMLELPVSNYSEELLQNCENACNCIDTMKDVPVQQEGNIICTCDLIKPCNCKLEGLWGKSGGIDEAAPRCRRCGQKVYAAEKLVASGGAFHTSCFSCYGCHKALEVTILYESQGEIYCKQCYAKYFGMSGYGYGATLLSPV